MGNFFDKKDMEFVRRHMGEELARRWEGLERKRNAAGIITVANTGLYSSGKSSLFNALLDQTENERFPVGAIPTTKSGDKETLARYVEIIDTPGIDATYEDDQVAIRMLMESDIILMTHNIKMGMLNKSEYMWMQNIKDHINQNDLGKRLVFVCTWIDEVTNNADRLKVTEELRRQIGEILGVEIPFWEVSAKRYCTAVKKNMEKLKNASNIPQFRFWLLEKADKYKFSAEKIRKEELRTLCEDSKEILQEKKYDRVTKYERIKKEVDRQIASRQKSWDMILECFKDMKESVQKKLKDLENERYDGYYLFEQEIKRM